MDNSKEVILWIAGQVINHEDLSWEFHGVFDTKEKAIESCINQNFFIGPAVLNEAWPEETTEWEGSYYPIQQEIESNE